MKTVLPCRVLLFSLACLFVVSCAHNNDPEKDLAGHWLILYPDHQLTSPHQRRVYGRWQDSIVSLYGLKLITLAPDGRFLETDSLLRPHGRWLLTPDSLLKIREGGKGFNPFNTRLGGRQNGELLLTQYLPLEDEKIKVVWHLKKIESDEPAARLFSAEANAWRQRPASPEPKKMLQKRLAAALAFYGDYFALVGKEATYFSLARVPLPLRFYQHAVVLAPQPSPAFTALFYNDADAATAYRLLEKSLAATGDYPSAENYVAEYGLLLKKWAGRLAEAAAGER